MLLEFSVFIFRKGNTVSANTEIYVLVMNACALNDYLRHYFNFQVSNYHCINFLFKGEFSGATSMLIFIAYFLESERNLNQTINST